MSFNETKRRKIVKQVMLHAWKIYRRNFAFSFSLALKLAWSTIRGLAYIHHSKVRGTTFENRQQVLRKLSLYTEDQIALGFMRDTRNSHDANAIYVFAEVKNKGRATLGYLSKGLSIKIAPLMDTGHQIFVFLDNITGSESTHKTLGLNFSYIVI